MSLCGKLETDVDIKVSAEKFHEMWSCRPHHISNASSDKIQRCDLHEGDFGKEGSVICWRYVHDGEAKTSKQIIEAVDNEKKSMTFKLIEGDLMKEFKNFKITLQIIPKDEGCVAHWIFEYEKLNEKIAHPETLVQLLTQISKEMDDHLTTQA